MKNLNTKSVIVNVLQVEKYTNIINHHKVSDEVPVNVEESAYYVTQIKNLNQSTSTCIRHSTKIEKTTFMLEKRDQGTIIRKGMVP